MLGEVLWIFYAIATVILMSIYGISAIVPSLIVGLVIDDLVSLRRGSPRRFR